MSTFKRDDLSSQIGTMEDKEEFTSEMKGIALLGKNRHVQNPTGKRG